MTYEYFRAAGAYETVQGLPTLFAISLQNDDVQDFDVRCDHALLSVNDPGRIVQVKTAEYGSTSDCDGIVRSRNGANQGTETISIF